MNTRKHHEPKRWVLLEQLPCQHSRRLLLILFLYSLAFTLLLVGLRMFCHNLQNMPAQSASSAVCSRSFQNKQDRYAATRIQQNIADQIIRLHVIAHSDTDEDQALKLKVRNEVLSRLQNSLTPADTQASAEHILNQMIPVIQHTAEETIQAEGYDYPVRAIMEYRYFPAKTYGDLTFPPGTYRALCIEIGKAEGKNWWCVLFPSLCFVDETTAEVPDTSKEKLENVLSEEAYQSLSNGSSPTPAPTARPQFHSAIYDWIRNR